MPNVLIEEKYSLSVVKKVHSFRHLTKGAVCFPKYQCMKGFLRKLGAWRTDKARYPC